METVSDHRAILGVAQMPYRKKPCLVLVEDNAMTKLASFNNEDSAKVFINTLLKLTGYKGTVVGD